VSTGGVLLLIRCGSSPILVELNGCCTSLLPHGWEWVPAITHVIEERGRFVEISLAHDPPPFLDRIERNAEPGNWLREMP
jgi:hypothetical protein